MDGYMEKLQSFNQDQDKSSSMVSEISKEGLQIQIQILQPLSLFPTLTKQLTMPCNY